MRTSVKLARLLDSGFEKRVPDTTRLSCLTKRNWVAFYICEKNTLSHKKLVIIYCLSTLAFLVILPVCCNISLGAVGSKSEDKGTHPLHRLMWCSLRVSDHNLGKGIFSLETPQFLSEVTVTQVQHRVVSLTPCRTSSACVRAVLMWCPSVPKVSLLRICLFAAMVISTWVVCSWWGDKERREGQTHPQNIRSTNKIVKYAKFKTHFQIVKIMQVG